MTRLAQAFHRRRELARTRRALAGAIADAGSPSMRDELLVIAQRSNSRELREFLKSSTPSMISHR